MWITREYIRNHRDTIFIFGDNVEGTGLGGHAKEARGEWNTIGIPTKWSPDKFFSDKDFDMARLHIDKAFFQITQLRSQGKKIVFFPNIGRGFAELDKCAPRILRYIEELIGAMK